MNYELKLGLIKFTITDTTLIQNIPRIKIQISDILGLTYKEGSKWINGEINVSANPIPMKIIFSYKNNELAKKIYDELRIASDVDNKEPSKMDLFLEGINKVPNSNTFGTNNVINELPNLLSNDEVVKAYTSGNFEDDKWLLVCTNKRVLLLNKEIFSPLKTKSFSLASITSISQSSEFGNNAIEITYGLSRICVSDILGNALNYFIQQVNTQKDLFTRPVNPTLSVKQTAIHQPNIASTVSVADEILKFKNLLDAGALTQEEFDMKKKQLLGL